MTLLPLLHVRHVRCCAMLSSGQGLQAATQFSGTRQADPIPCVCAAVVRPAAMWAARGVWAASWLSAARLVTRT